MDPLKTLSRAKNFDPANPAYRFRLWVSRRTKDGIHIHIFWRRSAIFLTSLVVVGWFSLALAVLLFVRVNRGITEARYVDVVFPWRWKNYHAAVGRHYLAAGHTLLSNGSIRGALTNLASGLAVVPDDIESRKLLAILQYRIGRADLATQTLLGGRGYLPPDPLSQEQVFSLLREMQANDAIAAEIKKSLPATADDSLPHLYLAMQLANAQFGQAHYEECEATVQKWRLERAPAGRVLHGRSLWEQGHRTEAISYLQGSLPQIKPRGEVYVALVRFYRELGDNAQMRHFALLHYLESPNIPDTRLDLIYAYSQTKSETELAEEEKRYLQDYRKDERALSMLSNVAAIAARPDIAADAYAVAKAQGYALAPYRLALIQADISSKDYKRALTDLTAGKADFKASSDSQLTMISGLESIARLGSGDVAGGDSALAALLKNARLVRTSEALFLAKAMRLAGGTTEAYQLLEIARDRDAKNQAAITEIVHADIDSKNHNGLVKHLPAFLTLQNPDPELLRAILPLLNRPEDAAQRSTVRHLAAKAAAASAQP